MKKLYLLIVGSFTFLYSFAQNAIDPNSSGNFDAGNTFASNGWTVVNSSANEWVVGTGASATPPSSPNTAYISIDGNTNNYSYDNTTKHISHFYRVVTLPSNAINIAFSFQLKGNFENDANGNLVDGLEVYTNDITDVPVADALPSGPNAFQQFHQSSNNDQYIGQSNNWNFYAGKTFLIIFTWINNGDNIGDGPPASVDGASLSYCIKGAKYNVTGGGSFCTGSSGVGVGLSSSDTAISYQLYNNGMPVGNPINGTGSAIDFGPQKVVGNYTITGTSACDINYTMTGSVNVTENPLPTATAGSNAPLCLSTALNLTSTGGSTYSWTGPAGFTSTAQNPSITNFSSAEAGVYTVTVTQNACSASASTTVSVTGGGVVGGTITSISICSSASNKLVLTGNSNSPSRWESTTDTTSGVWNSISNTNNFQNISGIVVPTYYRAVISDGCGQAYSDTATVSIRNYWIGTKSIDWNTKGNWSDGQLPSTSCDDVFIPGGTAYEPTLNSGTATITNLHIYSGGKLTVTGAKLQIGGTISNAGVFNASNGTIELNAAVSQNIPALTFQNNAIKDLVISNAPGVTLGGEVDVYESLSYGVTHGTLNTGGFLTLKSSAAQTAWIGNMTGETINGDVTVERYIDVAKGHGAAWEFVATPTQGQSVFQSWMEKGSLTSTGYGTQITSPNGTANGFDATTPGASLKYFLYNTTNWQGISNTSIPVYNQEGYMLFVRGDRSITYPHIGNTTLRTSGKLLTPANPPPPTTVHGNNFASIGNPYASAVSLSAISAAATGVSDFFYVWDPTLSGAYGVGGYRTLSNDGTGLYIPTPSGGGGDYAGGTRTLESGQAFFVHSFGSANGSVTFNEAMKSNGSKMVFRGADGLGTDGKLSQLRANLYGIGGDSTFLVDGNLLQYNQIYSDNIDGNDAKKLINSLENFGISSGGKNLAIERRAGLRESDTIYYNQSGMRSQGYKILFTATGLSAYPLQGFIEDTYLKTRKPLNMEGNTEEDFTITGAAGSYASNRFRIVFSSRPPLAIAITFISLTASRQDAGIAINWNVRNENGMSQYQVEKSIDGVNFTKVATVIALNNGIGAYQWIDEQAAPGDNYYRVKCIEMDGRINFSEVVKVKVVPPNPSIGIYPNPIKDGIIHLHFVNQPKGRYGIRLLNSSGQLIIAKQVNHDGGNFTENLQWNFYLSHGVYQLEIKMPDSSLKNIKVLY